VSNAGHHAKNDLRRRAASLSGNFSDDQVLRQDLLKLRAVVFLLSVPHGAKSAAIAGVMSALAEKGVPASRGSLYRWRSLYLRSGFAGIIRKDRRDKGRPRKSMAEVLPCIVDAATRVHRTGDIAREFRKIRPKASYEAFRRWVRTFQKQIGVLEIPPRRTE
jgi:hypothetical protein